MNPTSRATIAAAAGVTGFLVIGLAAGQWAVERDNHPAPVAWPVAEARSGPAGADPGLLYGRVTTVDGATREGRLRFGGDEEAYWGDYFNGFRDRNPWVDRVPAGRLPSGEAIEVFGIELARREGADFRRPFMVRFGDIAKLEARGRDLRVTLKSGNVAELDRYGADDFADGVRVWDEVEGVVDLGERRIRSIEFLAPAGRGVAAPPRLHGTVRTRAGDFTGFLQWDREEGVALDALEGHAEDGELLNIPFTTIRSVERHAGGGALVTLLDGHRVLLSGTREVGPDNRGIYVDDGRYGRVLVSWNAFERADFSPAGPGPGYHDFPPGRPLAGTVVTRSGRSFTGRLVYDLDETETVETLDAPALGVDYTIPFTLVASIELSGDGGTGTGRARVTLRSGELLELERSGDLGDGNAGLLIFVAGREEPEYVPWGDVGRVDFGAPPG